MASSLGHFSGVRGRSDTIEVAMVVSVARRVWLCATRKQPMRGSSSRRLKAGCERRRSREAPMEAMEDGVVARPFLGRTWSD